VAEREVCTEFVFERTAEALLAQAYRILVPERRGRSRHKSDLNTSGACSAGETPIESLKAQA